MGRNGQWIIDDQQQVYGKISMYMILMVLLIPWWFEMLCY